jgi:hypothetical protein
MSAGEILRLVAIGLAGIALVVWQGKDFARSHKQHSTKGRICQNFRRPK